MRPGVWQAKVRVVEPDGRRRRLSVYGATQAKCRDAVLAVRNRVANAEPTKDSPATLKAYLEQWVEDVARPSVRPATYRCYRGSIANHLAPRLGAHKLARLTALHIQHALADMERDGASARTRELAHAVLRAALNHAERLDLIRRNPIDHVDSPRVERKEMRVWSPEQVAAFLTVARTSPLYMLYRLALATGMRQGELLGLRWTDVDLPGARISVQSRMDAVSRTLEQPKTRRGRRSIPLSPSTVAELSAYQEAVAPKRPKYVLCNTRGGALRASNVYRRSFVPLVRAAGVPLIRFQDLRHTAATLMLLAGVHPKVVQEILGHGTIGLTLDTYSHVLASIKADAPDATDRFLAGFAVKGPTNGPQPVPALPAGHDESLTG